ncbi:MAG: hypothetical protein QXU18_12875 [Thermoplasmatales archaeon]
MVDLTTSGSKKIEFTKYPRGWEAYSALRKIVLEIQTESFDSLSKAFIDLYRFQAGRKRFEERELIRKVLELENLMKSILDWKIFAAYVIYGYLWSKIRSDQSKLMDAVNRCKDNDYFLGTHEGGFQIINTILGFVYSLADSAVNDSYINDIFGRLENRESDLAELFEMNYFLGLFLFDNKWYQVSQGIKESCAKIAKKIDLNEVISPKEKIVILPFLDDKGARYFQILTEEIALSEYYLHLHSNGFYENQADQESSWLQLSPIWIVKFLLITENLGWNELLLVPPTLLGALMKIEKLKEPVVLSKKQYYIRVSFLVILTAYVTFTISSFIFGITPVIKWMEYLSVVITGASLIYFVYPKLRNYEGKRGKDK